jgi:hypothetical protein
MNCYFDILLDPLPENCFSKNQKILILGKSGNQVVIDLINRLKAQYQKNHTIISNNINLRKSQTDNIFSQFSQLLKDRCFIPNTFLFIDACSYTDYDIKSISQFKNNQLVIIQDDPEINSISYINYINSGINSGIKFDYIFLLDSVYIKQNPEIFKKVKIPNLLEKVLEKDIIIQKNKDFSKTEIINEDISNIIDTIEVSNNINEPFYLVLDTKNEKLCYFC